MTRINHLLAALPADVLDRLRSDLEEVALPFGAILEDVDQRWITTLISAATHWIITFPLGPLSALTRP